MQRKATVDRKTKETEIRLSLNLDGTGQYKIETPVPFVSHMLQQIAVHGGMDLEVSAKGDVEVDAHHTVEDIAICLGEALRQALGDKAGITRYGTFSVPLDEALSRVTVDFSGRPYLVYRADVRISGRLAILGDMVLRATAGMIIGEVARCLRARLEAPAGPEPASG